MTALSLVCPIFLFFDPVSIGDGSFSCIPYLSFLWSCVYWWRPFLLSALSFFSLILSLLVTALSLVYPVFLFFDPVSIGDGFFSCQPYLSFLWSCLYWWQLFLLFALSLFSLILSLLVTALSLVCPIFLFFDPVSVGDGSFSCLPCLSFLWSCLYWWWLFLLSALSFFSLILSLLVTAISLVCPIFVFFDPVSIGDGSFSCLPYLSFLWSCLCWWRLFLLSALSFFSLILSLLVTALSLVCPIFLFFDPVSIGDGSFSCLPYLFSLILSLLVTALSLVCPIFLFFDLVSIGDGSFSCLPYLSFLWSRLFWWRLFLLSTLSFFSLILSLVVTALSLVCPIFLFLDPVSICDGSFSCLPCLSFLWSYLYWWQLFLLSTLSFFSSILSLLVTALSLVCRFFLFFDPISIGDDSFSCLPYLSFRWSCLYLWRLFLLSFLLSVLSFFSLILSLLVAALFLVCPIFLFFFIFSLLVTARNSCKMQKIVDDIPKCTELNRLRFHLSEWFLPLVLFFRTVWDSTISSSMHAVRSAVVWTTDLGKIPLTKDRNSSKLSFLGLRVSKGFPYYCHTQYSAPRSRSYLWVKYWYWKTLQKK